MTREEAISWLVSLTEHEGENVPIYDDDVEALNMAISALEHPEKNVIAVVPCGDAISRSDVLKLMQDNWHTHNGDWAMQESMDDIRALPSITPIRPKGHWMPTYGNVKCSECGSVKDRREVSIATHYCSFCGAKIESEGA